MKYKGLIFDISGQFACFRVPETNSSVYLTYSCIHKVALCGICGAIIGAQGYAQTGKNELPEFYTKLSKLKYAIISPKKNVVQQLISFNNSTGLASSENGGNLIVKENVLLKPSWQIIILEDDSDEYNKLKDCLLNHKTKFIPYLGRNDYPAVIENVKEIELEKLEDKEDCIYDSLVMGNISECIKKPGLLNKRKKFLSIEKLPIGLDEKSKHYQYESFLLTNEYLPLKENTYKFDNKIIQFI